jgi:DNA polymerase III subunit gamma/tau
MCFFKCRNRQHGPSDQQNAATTSRNRAGRLCCKEDQGEIGEIITVRFRCHTPSPPAPLPQAGEGSKLRTATLAGQARPLHVNPNPQSLIPNPQSLIPMPDPAAEIPSTAADPRRYMVVARRYRPQTFVELIGQEHVAQALSNAIASQRVGHAYLFTGARGVGKTSAARILAKALNCEKGPSPTPCNQCDICQSIGTGEDVDVLEIDGASNRGIDEIRQLRQNVGVRPSRARYKIYIIDEVHMLTREAFNALLKTLEEPPEHVKFIFCTTEPTKIPITILSRCQRFDFAGILASSIRLRLEQIVAAEGLEAESEALEILARRAAGSMRDSQSLLEQLLAFAPGRITTADVYGMLGSADEELLASLVGHLVERNPAGALADLDAAINAGVDAGQLIEQLFGSLRDCMAAAVGCPAETFLYTSPSGAGRVAEAGKKLGLNTLLAVMQILDQALARMRYSTQGRILAELALVRICHLANLDELSEVIGQLQAGGAGKKKYEPAVASGIPSPPAPLPQAGEGRYTSPPVPLSQAAGDCPNFRASENGTVPLSAPKSPQAGEGRDSPPSPPAPLPQAGEGRDTPAMPLTAANAMEIWSLALARMTGIVVDQARQFDSVAISGPNRLVIRFKPGYALFKSACERPEQVARFERALAEVTGQAIRVEFALTEDAVAKSEPQPSASVPVHQRLMEATKHPFVQKACELFDAQPVRIDGPTG